MKHISESIIGRKGSLLKKSMLSNRDIIKTRAGDYLMVIKDIDTWNITGCLSRWDSDGILFSIRKGGAPYDQNFIYLRDYNDDLYLKTGRAYDVTQFDIIGVWKWKPKNPKDSYITFYTTILEKIANGNSPYSKDYTKTFDRK